jgi:hypothetical protein
MNELVDVVNITEPDPVAGRTLTTWRHLHEWRMPNGELVADYLLREVRQSPPAPELATLRDVLDALAELSGSPADKLGRLVGGVLDLYSHRVDAWVTSLATARLRAMRDRVTLRARRSRGSDGATSSWQSWRVEPGREEVVSGLRHDYLSSSP